MTAPPPPPTKPPTPRGPNPLLLLGILAAASSTFLILANRRNDDPAHKRREFHGPKLPPLNAPKVDMPVKKGPIICIGFFGVASLRRSSEPGVGAGAPRRAAPRRDNGVDSASDTQPASGLMPQPLHPATPRQHHFAT
ncbi:uncharacterized protein LOC62_07G009346 [Vanrija pseudolonga]|uniref:Uncharacterized protein n=1 Tax=Vanrija pseudolonga TaxID=143232 RepID=A0AAF1BRG3_9TREE|nr:hypothetical protein LOC62_07G009346 [Vanrija pseudolonga]